MEVYSTVDGNHVAEIGVPGPAGLSFSPDYKELVVGTITPYVYLVDPSALHITAEIAIPPGLLGTDAQGDTLMPVMPYAMADGSIFLAMGVTSESSSTAFMFVAHLLRYDSSTNTFTAEDPGPSGLLATPARSEDGKYLLCTSQSNSAQVLFLYSVAAEAYVATSVPANVTYLAANADGSQFASISQIVTAGNSNSEVAFWSANLNQQGTPYIIPATVSSAPVYSRDGNDLYVSYQTLLYAINTQTGQPAGYLGISVGSLGPSITLFDADENNHLFGAFLPGGAVIVNASQLDTVPPPLNIPAFIGPSTEANPNVGPAAGGTQVQFIPAPTGSGSSDGISDSMEAYFGSTPATQDIVAPYAASSNGENYLTATSPPASVNGPVSVLLTDANNNPVFLPDAYTYAPHLLRVTPNVASASGGDQITIVGYGFGFDRTLAGTTITVGGTSINTAKVLNSYGSNAYPEQTISFSVPPGTPGWASIEITTRNGTDILPRGLEFLQAETSLTGGPFGFAVYDSVRNRFYLTGNGSSVAIFDPNTQSLLAPLQSAAVSPSATLESEALTPDSNTLLVADPSDQLVLIFDLVAGTSTAVKVVLPSDGAVTLSAPMSVASAANGRAFVSLSPCIPDPVREIDLTNLSVQMRPDAATSCPTYVPYPQLGGSSFDGSTIIFAANNELEPPGPEYVWRYDDSSDTFQGPTLVADSPWVAGWAAVNQDGSVIALCKGTLDQRLLPLVPILQSASLDSRLNQTGSLLYASDGITHQITVSDTHNGFRFLTLNFSASTGPYRPLAIDPTGQQILVATQAGLSYFKLSVVPLAVGTVSPSQGQAGTSIQLKGSGFASGTIVQIGGQATACNVSDSETMSCTVPNLTSGPTFLTLTNPDGQTYHFENAFTVQ